MIGKIGTMGQGWELSILNLESARGEQVWVMAREEQCTAAAGRPGAKGKP
jgi:hypothetical protein